MMLHTGLQINSPVTQLHLEQWKKTTWTANSVHIIFQGKSPGCIMGRTKPVATSPGVNQTEDLPGTLEQVCLHMKAYRS